MAGAVRSPISTISARIGARRSPSVPALSDVVEWRLAVVLSVDGEKAEIGLQPARDPGTGAVGPDRETGTIPFEQMKWTSGPSAQEGRGEPRPVGRRRRLCREGRRRRGDVSAPPGPRGRGRARRHGPAYRPRAGHGRRLLVQPRASSTAPPRPTASRARPSSRSSTRPRSTTATRRPRWSWMRRSRSTRAPASRSWRPENYSHDFLGPSTLRTGIELSRNVMTVRLAQDMGMPLVAEYARRFGIYDNLPPFLPMALGAGETTVLRMVAGLLGHRQWRPPDQPDADRPHPGPLRQDHLPP